jgi:hypothetical protein
MHGALSPVVQTVVVEQKIAGIKSHDDYSELRGASLDAEVIFLTRLQETLQKNLGSFRNDMRDLVVEFFEDNRWFLIFPNPFRGIRFEVTATRLCFFFKAEKVVDSDRAGKGRW